MIMLPPWLWNKSTYESIRPAVVAGSTLLSFLPDSVTAAMANYILPSLFGACFASQTSLSNIISGLFLVGEKQINLGDMIEVGGITGNVDSINLMSVQLRLPNNTMVRIPNEMIIKNPVSNITRFSTRRCDLDLGVDYNCDIEHVVSILQEVVKQNKLCLDDPAPVIMFTGFQDSSLGFKIGAWCLKDNFLDCQKTLAHDIKHRFAAEGISFPFPTRSLESRSPIQVEISGTAEKNQ